MTTNHGGGDGHSPDPLSVPSALCLAKISEVIAIQYKTTLIISCTGSITGFDGSLTIAKSDALIYPPMFSVFARPGNCGVTGECPTDSQGVVTQAFHGRYREVQVVGAEGTLRPIIRQTIETSSEEHTIGAAAGPGGAAAGPADEIKSYGWSAWINMMPMANRTLYTVGRLMMPTPGFKLSLKRTMPQGINPNVLLLDIEVEPPKGIVEQSITPVEVRYEEKVGTLLYTAVHIRNTNIVIPVTFAW